MRTYVRRPESGGGILWWKQLSCEPDVEWLVGDDNGKVTLERWRHLNWEPSTDVFYLFEDE